MKRSEILRRAARRITKPDAWCRGTYAIYDYSGHNVRAVAWCAIGAVGAVCGSYEPAPAGLATANDGSPIRWNALAALYRAAAEAEASGQ